MKEKSLLYNLLMKYLGDEGADTQDTPLGADEGQEKKEYDKLYAEEDPERESHGSGHTEIGAGILPQKETLIETVEDWNEAELEKQRELDARSRGGELTPDEEAGSEPEEETAVARDASLELNVSADKMEAMLMVWEPEGGGAILRSKPSARPLRTDILSMASMKKKSGISPGINATGRCLSLPGESLQRMGAAGKSRIFSRGRYN